MQGGLFVYISGPITARDEFTIEENVAQAVKVFCRLLRLGVPAFCPHLSASFPSAWLDVPYETWLAYDLAVIDRCSHVLMLPRWETSDGAIREHAHAVARGIPIVDNAEQVLAAR